MDALKNKLQAIRLRRDTEEQREHATPPPMRQPSGADTITEETKWLEEKETTNSVRANQDCSTSEEYGEVDNTDPLFGNEEGGGVKYKTCGWWNVGLLMIAECISLGILSLPHAMATLGLVR
jgi:hypothetical protein